MQQVRHRQNWKPIETMAAKAAADLGHKLERFERFRGSGFTPLKMASCESCYGCCWVAHTPARGFIAGGRLLKYRCGTPEAAGVR